MHKDHFGAQKTIGASLVRLLQLNMGHMNHWCDIHIHVDGDVDVGTDIDLPGCH